MLKKRPIFKWLGVWILRSLHYRVYEVSLTKTGWLNYLSWQKNIYIQSFPMFTKVNKKGAYFAWTTSYLNIIFSWTLIEVISTHTHKHKHIRSFPMFIKVNKKGIYFLPARRRPWTSFFPKQTGIETSLKSSSFMHLEIIRIRALIRMIFRMWLNCTSLLRVLFTTR